MLAVLGRPWGVVGRPRAKKCEKHSYLENMLISRAGARSAAWGVGLEPLSGSSWRSWAALGPYVGGLGLLLGPMLAVLGCSWGLCWRSWAALRAYVGGPGRSWVEKWPWPERKGDLVRDPALVSFSAARSLLRICSIDICIDVQISLYTRTVWDEESVFLFKSKQIRRPEAKR